MNTGGNIGAVLPWSFLQADYAQELRLHLYETFEEISVLSLSEKYFEGADERVVLLWLKNFGAKNKSITIASAKDINGKIKYNNLSLESWAFKKVPYTGNDSAIKLIEQLATSGTMGAIAPQLLNEDHTIQPSCRTFPRYWDMFCELTLLSKLFPMSKIFARWKMNYFNHNEIDEVEQPMAAALMIKKNVMDKVNGFDERYKMFFNDVDLCKSIVDAGYKIYFYPDSKIFHLKGASIYKDRKNMLKIWNDDCITYFKKHYNNFLLIPLLSIGLKISLPFRK